MRSSWIISAYPDAIFTWPLPTLNPIDPGFSGGSARAAATANNITDTYTNTTGLLGEATYAVTPYYNGCQGATVDVVVQIGAQPVLDPNLDDEACSRAAIGLPSRKLREVLFLIVMRLLLWILILALVPVVLITMPPWTEYWPITFRPTRYTNGLVWTWMWYIPLFPSLEPPVLAIRWISPSPFIPSRLLYPDSRPWFVVRSPLIMKYCCCRPILRPERPSIGPFLFCPMSPDRELPVPVWLPIRQGPLHLTDAIQNYSGANITATYTITPTSCPGLCRESHRCGCQDPAPAGDHTHCGR